MIRDEGAFYYIQTCAEKIIGIIHIIIKETIMQRSKWYELNMNSALNLFVAIAPNAGLDTMRGFVGTLGHTDIRQYNSIGGVAMKK